MVEYKNCNEIMSESFELETRTYQYKHMKTNVELAFFLLKLGGSF